MENIVVSVEPRSWPVAEEVRSEAVGDGEGDGEEEIEEVESERPDEGFGGARVNDNASIYK